MDEQRKFFRIKNKGEMQAQVEGRTLQIIDLSACSAAIVPDLKLPPKGVMEFKINLFKINLNYEVVRSEEDKMILVFTEEAHINKLLPVLKNFRRESE